MLGVYDKQQVTELPRAYIVLKPGHTRNQHTADEIVRWLTTKVADHKRLRGGVSFVDEIPKSQTGKILRRVLRDRGALEAQKNSKL